jgi:ATP-binding cassette subfamily B protein RaxB
MKSTDYLLFRRKPEVPVVLSTELAECGLACLAMVAAYHGHEVDLNTLRQRFSVSMSGASLRGLMKLSDHLGLSTRALRVEMSALDRIVLPAIIHWDMNHFVVLESVSRNSATIHDPRRGKVKLSLQEFSNHFTGVVLELAPSDSFEKVQQRQRLRITDLFSRISGHRLAISYVLLLSIGLQLVAFVLPFQMQLVVDKAIGSSDAGILAVVAIGFAGLTVLNAVLGGLRNWTLQLLGSQLVFQVAGNIFRHLIRLSASFFEKRHLGDVLTRMGSIRQIQDALTQGLLSAVIDGSMAILAAIVLVMYSPTMAAIIGASVLAYAGLIAVTYPAVRKQTEKSIAAGANEHSYLMESIRGVVPLKLMAGEPGRESGWRNLFGRSYNESMALARLRAKLKFVEEVLFGLQFVAILYLGAMSIMKSQGFTLGMLYSFLAFRAMFTERVLMLIAHASQLGMLSLYAERLSDFVLEKAEVAAGSEVDAELEGDIVMSEVSFRYGATDPMVLEKVNLEIHAGEFVAITGATGGGKTTLFKLLLGLQQPTEGAITLNGERATPALWQAWRAHIGVVRQDDQLFSGSLAENISFFDPDIDMGRVREAAAAAAVSQEIESMPMRYLTLVGDMGSSLSGGQRQRILLARALYRKPKLLLLDEGTANLDPATEELIANMIAAMPITRIVIAHRPALVERASQVLKVNHGRIETVRDDRLHGRLAQSA